MAIATSPHPSVGGPATADQHLVASSLPGFQEAMCGICGIFEYGRSRPLSLAAIEAMTDAVGHRGPDDRGTWIGDRVALGHQRLSIFDLSAAGRQPMFGSDQKAVTVLNGEIYNFVELREEHERDGTAFRTTTDTEVLLAHYQRHGIDCLGAFRGMFAFAIWDVGRERLYVVRDRLGIKPLYYCDLNGVLLFASEIKSLLEHPSIRPILDRGRLAEWLALRYTIAPGTLFQNIEKLEPGHYLVANRGGVRKVRYWDLQFDVVDQDPVEAADRYLSLLRDSIRLRMRADVPVGVFLSGGLDSSAVAVESAQLVSKPLETFTVGYRGRPDISELHRARLVSQHIGSVHHELELDEVRPDVLDSVVWHLEEPIGDPATVLVYKLAEYARQRVTVVLTGEGSDETNLGYPKTSAYQRWAGLSSYPLVGPFLASAWLRRIAHRHKPGFLSSLDAALVYSELSWPGASGRATVVGEENRHWLQGLRTTLERSGPLARAQKMHYLDLKGWMVDDLLLKVDKMTMAYALEARVPFLDHKLVEFNLGLPSAWKIGPEGTKLFLRRLMRGRLPDETVAGRQHGFIAPLHEWFSQPWAELMEHSLGPDGIGKRELFPARYLDGIRSAIRERRPEALVVGFMLASLERWFQAFSVEVGEPVQLDG